ncbi:MAG: pantoate--beta-alanine ligase, partial [Candidatus Dadabacteria bacterium]|nr:pantoate--beta-alanine ligase [Candidatus Dadabacteria bacterium]NIQ13052.1 pantoate--beta-alanine ligase [Candidatus Dadabacteria bacterium]
MSIIRINESLEMQNVSNKLRSEGKSIAFVPTMGALHEGHLSLVDEACKKADEVVVSIFVNPKQFGPNEDYGEYIRDLEGDLKKLSKYKVGYLFNPGVKDIYNEGFQTYVVVEELQKFLCGKIRPGHFKGVSTVVLKLFNIVKPDFAVFGKKDYQQFKLIERMVKDLNLEIEIIGMPIIREESGLAMSSRNKYLSENEKKRASNIYKSLNIIKKLFYEGQN